MKGAARSRVLVIAHDKLFPSNHGYRIDVARRLQRLLDLGCEVGVVCLSREREKSSQPLNEADGLAFYRCFGLESYINPWLAQLRQPATPWPSTARTLKSDVFKTLVNEVAKFSPDMVLLEGLYSIDLVQRIGGVLPSCPPLIYRSHNIEYQYMRGQLAAASDPKSRINLALSVKGLEAMERRAMMSAKLVLDISWDDSRFWSQYFGNKVLCLPPLPRVAKKLPVMPVRWDVGYCGNLNAPNNVEAITWFVSEIWSQVAQRHGGKARLVLAGSNPTAAIKSLLRPGNGIEIVPNPPSMDEIYAQVKVLINPALRGSGVNIKTIDMISVGKPMVLSAAAVAGLPPAITEKLRVARSRQEWIAAFDADIFTEETTASQVMSAYTTMCDESYQRIFAVEASTQPASDWHTGLQ